MTKTKYRILFIFALILAVLLVYHRCETERLLSSIKVGQTYITRTDNPYQRVDTVKVLDVKENYLQYRCKAWKEGSSKREFMKYYKRLK